MSEMVERARAIVEDEMASATGSRISSKLARRLVRAVIEAMNEPTEAMLLSATSRDYFVGHIDTIDANIVFTAMVDEALK
ncbi:MAG: hypothetical protein WDN46_14205 [Methylocella sp.]